MIIDFHTHTFPDKIAAAAVGKLQSAGHIPAYSNGTAAGLTASMQEAGITNSVVLPVATNPMKLASMNTASIAQNEQHGLIFFGAMHPDAPDWKEELQRLAAAGIKGIKIHPLYQGVDIDDIRYLRILGHAAELGLITVMHAGDDIGYPGIVRSSPEMIRNALNQLGSIPIVLAHMGGWKNWDRVVDCLVPTCACIDTSFSLGQFTPLEPGYYSENDCALLTQEAFCRIVDAFGSERVLFGTDSPWASQKEAVQQFKQLPLTLREQENILSRNACKLLSVRSTHP